jgi:hypothetical protein
MKILNWVLGIASILLISKLAMEDIITEAASYIGSKEKLNNSGFENAQLEKDMKSVGWTKGASWCVFFTKMIWWKYLTKKLPNHWLIASKLITGNSQDTYKNFTKDKSGLFVVSAKASVGAIVIFQKYSNNIPLWEGHAGIVESYSDASYTTIEGNTNNDGSNNGDGVYRKVRKYTTANPTGLRLKGFINIKG